MIFCKKCIHQKGCGKMLNCNRYEGELDRPNGEWIDKGEYAECSICGAHSGTQFDGVEPIPLKTNFCPNCGAKMRQLIHGCSFASEECKKNPCADCGVREGDEK